MDIRSWAPVRVLRLFGPFIPLLLFLQGCGKNEFVQFLARSKSSNTIILSEFASSDEQCVFPTGVVLAYGEAARIFKTRNVRFESDYNSHSYWFVAFYRRAEILVVVYPVHEKDEVLTNDDFVCGPMIELVREGGALRARLRGGK